ncbi:MAG: hypothetical protein JW969_02555 [Spirochaetales bacterium]|nr:hypothetical protein [Spirochaetales bacterium]
MSFRKTVITVLQFIGLFVVYLGLDFLRGRLIPMSREISSAMPSSAAEQMPISIFLYTLFVVLVIMYAIKNSHWHGLKLIGAMILVTTGFQTFMEQIDTVVFMKAFPLLTPIELTKIIIGEVLVMALFVTAAVFILGKWKNRNNEIKKQEPLRNKSWFWKIPVLAFIYMFLYFLFGMFPITFPEVKNFYTPQTADLNFIILFTVAYIRGILWVLLSLPVLYMMRGKRTETYTVLVLLIAMIPALGLLIPGPLMPDMPRLAHFIEIVLSNGLFGICIVAMIAKKPPVNSDEPA